MMYVRRAEKSVLLLTDPPLRTAAFSSSIDPESAVAGQAYMAIDIDRYVCLWPIGLAGD